MDPARVVEVYARLPGGGWSSGSGDLVGGRLGLAAAHVVARDGRALAGVRVRFAGGAQWLDGTVRWRGGDGALVEIAGQVGDSSAGGARWGRLTTTRPGTRVESVGFPAVLEAPDRTRDTEHL